MKKIMILIVSAVVIIAGGYFTMEYLNQKEKEEKFWNEQKERVEKYIHYNIKDVKSIKFTKNDVSPMGVPSVEGYINNDKELWFDASISTTDKFEDKFGCSGELDKMIKKPAKSVSEIEKEEKEKKQE
ncbi:hypothetical protein BK718_10970 [Bacillus thuringiensis serovar andalousiensis]|uniref:DUF1433 domain-containing protein n=2 Tax=Bacillus cereus group TaxID=86661 RepID=A0A9X6Q111_BACTU|nr:MULTISPECIES: DUF1433 domain-containing protein [Bacillus cereus group]MDA2615388.1 DUF1433 domain-containing protein [Bacillus cereus]MDZ3953391.1 DUF1433 domain-containing protein [Bacillus thuringiensis]MEB8554412.1 DUF1433 domain-containing protein [Bacillus cereus]MEB8650896.1 DUF1433 domain-containing protein [Bacillus cereus]MEB8668182.1 DUF1433 domain-containing protein [Bacillus cereus]